MEQSLQVMPGQERISKLEQRVSALMEALRLARHKQFGASSEKLSEDAMEQLRFLLNEEEAYTRRRKQGGTGHFHCCPQVAQEALGKISYERYCC